MSKRMLVLMCSIFLVVPLLFVGCSGDDGTNGVNGVNGTNGINGTNAVETAKPESCQTCHGEAGDQHQAFYDQLYQDNVIKVTISGVTVNPDNTVVVSFNTTKNDAAFSCKDLDNLNIYFTQYDNTLNRFQFASGQERLSIKGKSSNIVYVGNGLCTSTASLGDNAALLANPGVIVVYGYDEQVGSVPGSRVKQVKFPYAALFYNSAYAALPNPYVSAANVEGCEKCHTVPYLKHGNIYGRVKGVAATDMITCKACHLDNGDGGHFIWQALVDDPVGTGDLWALFTASTDPDVEGVEDFMTQDQKDLYAYKTRLMNDVHMSHAMEFEYPQSMATCNTCHEGKLGNILKAATFTAETCKSCHPVTGLNPDKSEKPQPSLTKIWADKLVPWHNADMTCNDVGCHSEPGNGKSFKAIHSGYDKKIYASDGTKYSTVITFTIDNASFNSTTNMLTFKFSGTGSKGALAATNAVPTVLVGLYGWDTKDYVVGPHESIPGSSPSKRNLEFSTASPAPTNNSPYITVTKTAGSAVWNATADLSAWAGKIHQDNSVVRVEIAVMPRVEDPALPKTFNSSGSPTGDNVVALNAPSVTFNLKTNKTEDFFSPIVKVAEGCNNCHDALAVNFHTPDRGGNIVVCRLCHTVRSGASHLEMQSRSIDSYAHAIHSFQAFDIQNVDFADPVESMFYDLKIESHFPTFDLRNCKSCHLADMFNVPNQSKSLPGVLSPSKYPLDGWDRNIGTVPTYVTGPGSRACGACHRAEMINEDAEAELISFNAHTAMGGYMIAVDNTAKTTAILDAVNTIIMSNYVEDVTVLPMP